MSSAMSAHNVKLNWTAPDFGQIRKYSLWRAVGNFSTLAQIVANRTLFTRIATISGAPPITTFTDTSVKNNTTYTYFLTDTNKQGVQSGPSAPSIITVKF
jgi:hypothetical protein